MKSSVHVTGTDSSLLATAIATVHSTVCNQITRLLIDPGSELSFVTEKLIKDFNVPRQHSSISILGIGGTKSVETRGVVSLKLQSIYSKETVTVTAHILKNVTSILPSFQPLSHSWPHLKNLQLADPDFTTQRKIDIVLGANFYGHIILPDVIKGDPSMPIAQHSIFGWLITGPVSSAPAVSSHTYHVSVQRQNCELQDLLTKFWTQEEVRMDNVNKLTPEEQKCEDHFNSTHSRDTSGRYTVRIPLKSPTSLLGTSYSTAHQCLQRTLRKFSRDDTYKQMYTSFMREYEKLGHMQPVAGNSTRITQQGKPDVGSVTSEMTLAHEASASGGLRVSHGGTSTQVSLQPYYLPHHEVLRPDSTTTKLRVVFNGSSSTSSGKSLNDLMYTGANLLLDVTDVLTWIRHHRHIFATDITKMYRQIRVHKDDWDLQRILWIDENFNETSYHLTTVTYGTKAAPFLAIRTLLQLAEDEGQHYPLALPSITKGRYVDDIFGGADSVRQLKRVAKQLTGWCNAGGFPLAKWHSTSHDLLKATSSNDINISRRLRDQNTRITVAPSN